MLYKYEDVRVVHLEITEKCQASCPMCDRNTGTPEQAVFKSVNGPQAT